MNPRTATTSQPSPRMGMGVASATVVCFYLISKVFRPEFEARRIEHRTGPDRAA